MSGPHAQASIDRSIRERGRRRRAWALCGLLASVLLAGCASTPRPSSDATARAGAATPADAAVSGSQGDAATLDPAAAPARAHPTRATPEAVAPESAVGDRALSLSPDPATGADTATPIAAEHLVAMPLDDGAKVFAALRRQLQTSGCIDDRVVQRWVSTYARSPARLAANLERVLPLLAHVVEQVRAAGLPGEFALLPIVESWYRPDARNGGTAGLWQFSTATARGNGLQVDANVDQRFAPGPSTRAALAHLAQLQEEFEDWQLAVMAFNAGEYRLHRARGNDPSPPSPQAHRPAGLALTTYEHLAKLLALACLVQHPERIGLQLPSVAFAPLDTALLGTAVVASTVPAKARVHQVRRGDSLWAIARRYDTSVARLRRWNGLSAGAVLRPGQRIRLHP